MANTSQESLKEHSSRYPWAGEEEWENWAALQARDSTPLEYWQQDRELRRNLPGGVRSPRPVTLESILKNAAFADHALSVLAYPMPFFLSQTCGHCNEKRSVCQGSSCAASATASPIRKQNSWPESARKVR